MTSHQYHKSVFFWKIKYVMFYLSCWQICEIYVQNMCVCVRDGSVVMSIWPRYSGWVSSNVLDRTNQQQYQLSDDLNIVYLTTLSPNLSKSNGKRCRAVPWDLSSSGVKHTSLLNGTYASHTWSIVPTCGLRTCVVTGVVACSTLRCVHPAV